MFNDYSRISTDGLKLVQAKEYWADHVGDACHNVQCSFRQYENFNASVEYTNLGFGKLTHFHLNGPHETNRLPHHIAKDKSESFYISIVRGGTARKQMRGRDVEWNSGGIYFGGISSPYSFEAGDSLEFSILFFDIDYIRQFIPHPEELFLKKLSLSSGWGRALAAMMSEITPRTVNHLALPPGAIAAHIGGLLTLSTGPAYDHLPSSRRSLVERLRKDLRDRLFDSTLNPTKFAAEHGISVRTLHAVFTASGTSFMNELLGMRLDRARSLLEDRRFDAKTIAEIADIVGFVNADHFSSRFRNAFSIPPTAWRSRNKSK